MKSINPYNLEVLQSFEPLSLVEITQNLNKIEQSFSAWKSTSYAFRAQLMKQLATNVKKDAEKYGKLASLEMGKPIQQAVAEVEKCAWVCEYYAKHAAEYLADQQIRTDYHKTFISYEPLGAILAVMPWNYPFWQVFRFAVPTIMAGNVAVLKHASNVPQSANAIEQMFLKAGFPEHVFTTLLMKTKDVEQLIQANTIKAVSLTGSERAGSIVSSQAAKEIKKSVLELGGNDAFIVCKDADLQSAVEAAITSRFQNNGQSCIAAKRFIIQKEVYDKFMKQFKERVNNLKIGDPIDKHTNIGPLANQEFVNTIHQQVQKSIDLGAKVTVGGKIAGDKNQFYEPTILENVNKGMPAFDEELFGPVASCMQFTTIDEAVEMANDSAFGLGGSVWTKNEKKGVEIARKIVTGTVAINAITKSDPRIPFGGVKKSGFGKELSEQGILEFVNQKVINIKKL